jgi:hypothetical protein
LGPQIGDRPGAVTERSKTGKLTGVLCVRVCVATAAAVAAPSIAAEAPRQPGGALPPDDPVFAAIKRHKQAVKTLRLAYNEIDHFYALADEAVGPSSIQVLDMRDPGTSRHVAVDCWVDIEKYVSPEAEPQLPNAGLGRIKILSPPVLRDLTSNNLAQN